MRSTLAAQASDANDGGQCGQCKFLGLDFARHPAVIENAGVRPAGVDFDFPFACRSATELQGVAGTAPLKLNMLVFKAGFAKDDHNIEMNTLSKAHGLRQKILQQFGPDLGELVFEEEALTTEFYVWARKRGAEVVNVEPKGLGSIKCVVSERASVSIAMAPLGKLQAAIGKVVGPAESEGMLPDLARIRRFLMSEVSQDTVDAWAASGDVTIHHMTLEEGDVLCTPPGWVVVERTMSSAALGASVSWLRATASAHANLASMHAMLTRLGHLNEKAESVRNFLKGTMAKISSAAPPPEKIVASDAGSSITETKADVVGPSATPPARDGSAATKGAEAEEVACAAEVEAAAADGAAEADVGDD